MVMQHIMIQKVVIQKIKVRQFVLRHGIPVSEFRFLFLVEAEAGLRAFGLRDQIVNQCSLVHRLSPLARIPTHQNHFVLSLFGDSFLLLLRSAWESTSFSRAVHPPISLFDTAETRALSNLQSKLSPPPAILRCAHAGCDQSLLLRASRAFS